MNQATGNSLVGCTTWISYLRRNDGVMWRYPAIESIKSDADGRFEIPGLLPGLPVSIEFQGPARSSINLKASKLESVKELNLKAGETRDVGEVRLQIKISAN